MKLDLGIVYSITIIVQLFKAPDEGNTHTHTHTHHFSGHSPCKPGLTGFPLENCEFYVAVAPVTRTAGILTQLVKGAGC